ILGGIGSLWGAIIGALAFLLLEEVLSLITEQWKLILGPFLVLVALGRYGGIAGLADNIRKRLARGRQP
ncbi:branched-chain amino acid ABC transporter permease, partial [Acinetobacter baumannii]